MLRYKLVKDLINKLRKEVIKTTGNPEFLHHEWYVQWHLEIVEKLALEFSEKYPESDKDMILTLVWLHDYGKIIDRENQYEVTTTKGRLLLEQIGFDARFIVKVIEYIDIFESKMTEDLSKAPIEVQIVSSADAASHMVGPFYAIYWKEFSHKTFEELMDDNRRKLAKDWDRKIVLPEVKEQFQERYQLLKEMFN